MDKRERVARAIADAGDWLFEGAELYRMADAAIAALAPVTVLNREGFGRDLLESWPVRDVDGAELFDAALRNGLIQEVPGGYDPEQHIDAEGIGPEKGDPWYEYAFHALADGEGT